MRFARVRHRIGSRVSTGPVSAAWRSRPSRGWRPRPAPTAALRRLRPRAARTPRTAQYRTSGRTARNSNVARSALRPMLAQQVEQQRRGQRAVHDQPRIALDLGDVAAVVVDAVAVEGQRRVAEQQHGVGHDRRAATAASAGAAAAAADSPGAPPPGRRCRVLRRSAGSPRRAAISWRTVTNTSSPLLPCLASTLAMVDVRATASPTRSGLLEVESGRPPTCGAAAAPAAGSRRAWRGRPARCSDCRCTGRKYSQCQQRRQRRRRAAARIVTVERRGQRGDRHRRHPVDATSLRPTH